MSASKWALWSLQRSDGRGLVVAEGTKAKMTALAARRTETAERLNMRSVAFVALPAGRQPTAEDIPPLPEPPAAEPDKSVPDNLRGIADELAAIAVAGTTGETRAAVGDRVHKLAAAAYELGAADTAADYRKSLGKAWGAWLSLMMSVSLPSSEGRSLLADVLDLEPELRERFTAFLGEHRA